MRRISSAELVRHFSVHSDAALHEPVVITRNGRDRLVLLSVARLRELLARALERTDDPVSRLALEDDLEALLSSAA
jgi:PHD/YefM family antitoxin component YafN of YafNO toxin-antitoxin module